MMVEEGLWLVKRISPIRFLVYILLGDSDGRIQSLVLGGVFITLGFVTFVASLLADAIATNRRLLESTHEKVRRLELRLGSYEERTASLMPDDDQASAPD